MLVWKGEKNVQYYLSIVYGICAQSTRNTRIYASQEVGILYGKLKH